MGDNYGLRHVCSCEIEIIICSLIGRCCITLILITLFKKYLGVCITNLDIQITLNL
jgi:hypothetical protein